MSDITTAYACTDCYIMAHDSTHTSPYATVDAQDIALTDWVCDYGELSLDGECMEPGSPDDICTACNGSGTASGITVGGVCDLGGHLMDGYWDYYTYIIH